MQRKFHVPDEVLQKTTKCMNGFSCLATGQCNDPIRCSVEKVIGENIIFIKTSDDAYMCPYRVTFGYGKVCRCPTHFALHQQRNRGQNMDDLQKAPGARCAIPKE